jgi:mycofactocin biosynthetic radical S-adenosylmethionine protein MftC
MRQHPIYEKFLAARVRQAGGFEKVWTDAGLFAELRRPQSGGACAATRGFFASCPGGCMAKFFTRLPLDGPDPECVPGHGAEALKGADRLLRPARPLITPTAALHEHGPRWAASPAGGGGQLRSR